MSAAQVYRAFDPMGRLLYVGCSVDVDSRMTYHADHSNWWPFHVRIDRQDFPTREAAEKAEAVAIATEHPRWNIAGRSQDHPDGFAASLSRAPWLDYERDVARRRREFRAEEQRLLKKIRKVRMAIAGIEAEVGAINAGLVIDEDVA